jgi:hypothetical protein
MNFYFHVARLCCFYFVSLEISLWSAEKLEIENSFLLRLVKLFFIGDLFFRNDKKAKSEIKGRHKTEEECVLLEGDLKMMLWPRYFIVFFGNFFYNARTLEMMNRSPCELMFFQRKRDTNNGEKSRRREKKTKK